MTPSTSTLRCRSHARTGLSLLETAVAVALLGIGLVMIAAIFPVALSEHRDSTDRAGAIELAVKAQAMLHGRLDPTDLWVSQGVVPGTDSPWYLLPTVNLIVGARDWDAMLVTNAVATNMNYANVLSGATDADPGNPIVLFGLDILSDSFAPFRNSDGSLDTFTPFTDEELMAAPNRLVWYGFYRRLANGGVQYAAAICKQRRNQIFAEQDLLSADFALHPLVYAANRRLPVPWRVIVGYDPSQPNRLFNTPQTPGENQIALARLAPPGSKIMIQGTVRSNPPLPPAQLPAAPAGRVLTVSDFLYNTVDGTPTIIEVVEDITDLPPFDYSGVIPNTTVTFDIWVFPPAVVSGDFGKKSPLIEWRLPL